MFCVLRMNALVHMCDMSGGSKSVCGSSPLSVCGVSCGVCVCVGLVWCVDVTHSAPDHRSHPSHLLWRIVKEPDQHQGKIKGREREREMKRFLWQLYCSCVKAS